MAISTSPASGWRSITKSDSTALDDIRGLYVGGAGNVALEGGDGEQVTFSAVPAGTILPVSPAKVLSTGTTATLIVALY